jgi:hypothetical protein
MYEVHLLQYKTQLITVFNVNPGNQVYLIIFFFFFHLLDICLSAISFIILREKSNNKQLLCILQIMEYNWDETRHYISYS